MYECMHAFIYACFAAPGNRLVDVAVQTAKKKAGAVSVCTYVCMHA